METKIKEIIANAIKEINETTNSKDLEIARVKYVGKTGEITMLNRMMKEVPVEQKATIGQLINGARNQVETLLKEKTEFFTNQEIEEKLQKNKVDITLPVHSGFGGLHPLTTVTNDIIKFFTNKGYTIYDGTESDTYEYNFDKLNIPDDHPARDSQDTFYINDDYLLRSHTSTLQIHLMQNSKPPLKMFSIGRCFRGDEFDATHSPIFEQYEVLYVDKNVTLSDLKTLIDEFAKYMYGENTEVRLRPSFFPFTEPSVEVDVTCNKCNGKGCSVCGSGWIEILGCGIVHPNVLEACGVDSKEYSGFAIGGGVDRLTMTRYNIKDIRHLYENDIRFLKQFSKNEGE